MAAYCVNKFFETGVLSKCRLLEEEWVQAGSCYNPHCFKWTLWDDDFILSVDATSQLVSWEDFTVQSL
jgi:hypothetical protein